ncbi:hypothetical protein [uncultured Zobellia sp.]|uniref:hypothetical protein n=1 Tax=uncultured Zobellia sp. TaxID=255433 RepID=UPI0025986AA5|nr:hypothetical protein [uncultured Zobellia sp.]
MTTLSIVLYGDMEAYDDSNGQLFFVKRKSKWTSNIILTFYKGNKLILKTSHYTINPFNRVKIDYQNLNHLVSINENELSVKGLGVIKIKQNNFTYTLNKRLGLICHNSTEIASVVLRNRISLTNAILEVRFTTKEKDLIFYSLLFLAIESSDMDGD